MSWTTAVADVRILISDGSTDKLRYRKEVFGNLDSNNKVFKTFEIRRITALVGAVAPVGVYNNGSLVAVSSEDLESGEFTLSAAPVAGDVLRATYYIQWFNDAEIQQFLTNASEWISGSDDWTQLANALWPAAKTYSAATAYQKLVSRFSQNLAEQYQLYDAPDGKRFDPTVAWGKESKRLFDLAFELRDDVYKDRQGRAKAPIAKAIRGRIRDVPPNS